MLEMVLCDIEIQSMISIVAKMKLLPWVSQRNYAKLTNVPTCKAALKRSKSKCIMRRVILLGTPAIKIT